MNPVYVYALDYSKLDARLSTYRNLIPVDRFDRLSALPPEESMRSLAAELLFQRAVRRHCPGVPLPVSRDQDKNGKPYLLGVPHFHFNLSHSGLWAVCAVAEHPIGVDIQQERPISAKLERAFTAEEQVTLHALPPEQYSRRLLDLWVMKEAFVKCTGEGLQRSFRSFEAETPDPNFVTKLVDFPAPGYHLSVCVNSPEPLQGHLVIMPV